MTRVVIGFIVIAAGLGAVIALLPSPSEKTLPPPLLITDVRVFDGTRFEEARTVLVEEGRIAAVGEDLQAPPGAQVINAAGLTALPGLIDAHTHTWGRGLGDALSFGVTTHLDMFSTPMQLPQARADRQDLTVRDRADLYSAGMLATVDDGHGTQFGVPVDTLSGPDEAEAWVLERVQEGSDYIKLVYLPGSRRFESLDLATATALIEAAHAAGLSAVAHISTQDAAKEMIAAGIDGLVHVFADTAVDAEFLAAARQAEIFVVPTLAVVASAAGTDDGAALAADPRVAARLSRSALRGLEGGFGAAPSALFQYPLAEANVRAMHEAGIAILAGSDAPNPGTAYGASLHQELQLLTQAGLSVRDALHAATQAPADLFQLGDRGRIAPGARADLVLVEGDPRADIAATLSIAHVIRNGAVLETGASGDEASGGAALETGDIGAFDAPTNGFGWIETADTLAGGNSQAANTVNEGVLRTEIAVQAGFFAPWAGAAYFPAATDSAALDVSDHAVLVLRLRAQAGGYRVMVFNPGLVGAPPEIALSLDERWRTVRLDLTEVEGFDVQALAGLAVVGGPELGQAWIEIAEARFEAG